MNSPPRALTSRAGLSRPVLGAPEFWNSSIKRLLVDGYGPLKTIEPDEGNPYPQSVYRMIRKREQQNGAKTKLMDATAEMDTPKGFSLGGLFDSSMRLCGQPIEFRVFDVQWCGALNEEWLRDAVSRLVSPTDLQWMLDQGLLRRWRNTKAEEGFTIYTPEQVQILQQLILTRRYTVEELRHVMNDWDDYLEAIVMDEPPYDDFAIPEYEHFKRRVQENIAVFESDEELYSKRPDYLSPASYEQRKAVVLERLTYWRRVAQVIDGKDEDQLSPRLREAVHRQLFELRWWEEFVRLDMARQFETAVKQGYSTEISFGCCSNVGGELTLSNIDWNLTLSRFRETRKEGKAFPLRTPAFNLTEHGIQLLSHLPPDAYAQMHEQYRLDELFQQLTEFGPGLWAISLLPEENAICPECKQRFERNSAKKVYCDDRCRKRAKSRRWRERDPERARLCQARYWKDYRNLE